MKKNGLIAVVLIGLAAAFFVACSDGGGSNSGNSGTKETLVTKFAYNLTSNATYYIVNEYQCVDNGDDTYSVKEMIMHYFSRETYSGKGGGELVKIVESGSVTPSKKNNYKMEKDITSSVKNASGEVVATYYIPNGLAYEIWFYN